MIIASILPALENVLIKNRSVLFLPNVYIFFNYIHQRLSMQMTLNIVGLSSNGEMWCLGSKQFLYQIFATLFFCHLPLLKSMYSKFAKQYLNISIFT